MGQLDRYLASGVTAIPEPAPVRVPAWVEFETAHPEQADAIDAAFMRDLAGDAERSRDFLAGIQAVRSGDALPAVVATTAGELRVWRRGKVREWVGRG